MKWNNNISENQGENLQNSLLHKTYKNTDKNG